jgi:hypothetical protein
MNSTMKLSTAIVLVAVTVLILTAWLTKVQFYPDLVIGLCPILFFALLRVAGMTLQIKRPVWPRMAFLFGLWGAAAGFRDSGRGFLLCGLSFAAIGIVIGIELQRHKKE